MKPLVLLTLALCGTSLLHAADDIAIADFEGADYGTWRTTGDAFGKAPAQGTLPGQMKVEGFLGKGLVNSFAGGDKSTGTLTSAAFKIERRYISFLIGGGGYANETCMNLLVGGKAVRTATGPNTQSGGSERLALAGWDVSEFLGREAVIEIIDRATGGWGHINVDQIVQTDRKPPVEQRDVTRGLTIEKRYLHFPVKNGAAKKKVEVLRDGKVERFFDIELADGDADWWAFLDVSAWRGEKLTVKANTLRDDSRALESISQDDDAVPDAGGSRAAARDGGAAAPPYRLYEEPLRPQLHFSARRGWLNDPNGLVFYKGEYHLFFQHNPYGWGWGNMHWGHAVSRDLVHWEERAEALYPDAMGPMFSGSAVVDWKNTSGFGKNGEPPIVLLYTAAGNPAVQCIAYSIDAGKTFAKYAGNPIVKQITDGNRDPKVIWHEPTQRWVMTLYVGFDEMKDAKKTTRHTIHFLTSANLKDWKVTSQNDGLFECPDFFELPIDNNARNTKWILTGASSEYFVGSFDGEKFTPETPKLPGHRGKGFYAAQTFSDIPASDGRRIQIGWLQVPSPGMSFNQAMTMPLVMKLISTTEGPRLTWEPVHELQTLRSGSRSAGPVTLKTGDANPLAEAQGELIELRASFEPGADSEVKFTVRGVSIVFNTAKQELTVNGHRSLAPQRAGKQHIVVYADRTAFEIFASDGLTYVPMPIIPKADARDMAVSVSGAPVKFSILEVNPLRSIWK
ncbi:MAG TPA: glycoside hydrolase family 32 protein [Methylomirabilota bacterium]|nr:glycoside hydrolase family 32 protein [Methylomirabilota bacterium]